MILLVSELSLVVPAYNEEKRIESVLENYLNFFRKKGINFEIIVVCNNCSDATPQLVQGLAKKNKELVFLNFPHYTGKGGAVFEGFKVAEKSIVGFTDADASTSPAEFFKIFSEVLNDHDCAIGSRSINGSVVEKSQPFVRVTAGIVFNLIVDALFGLGIPDTLCGAKVFKKNVIDDVLPTLKSKGWEFDVELLWKIKKSGFEIKQVPIVWSDSKDSKLRLSVTPKMFFALLQTRMGF